MSSIRATSREGLTILVVDNDRTTADVILGCIDRSKLFKLIEVATGEEASEVLTRPYEWQAPLPDLVVVDASIYQSDFGTLKTAQFRAGISSEQVIVVGNYSGPHDAVIFSPVLDKPLNEFQILSVVGRLYPLVVMARATAPPRSGQIFLSHSSGDKEKVRTLFRRLVSDGLVCWFDEHDLLGGQDWECEISRAIRESEIFIACLSRHSVDKRGYVQTELRKALNVADQFPEGAVYMLPVRLEDCVVPSRLTKWQYIDLFRDDGYQRLLKSLWAAFDGSSK